MEYLIGLLAMFGLGYRCGVALERARFRAAMGSLEKLWRRSR